MDTIFGKIIKGEIPSDKVFENDKIIVIKDINPQAPVHLLLIPKKEIKDIQSISVEDLHYVEEILIVAKKLAKDFHIDKGYRLLTNNGVDAGQTVFHLHFHLLGGSKLGEIA